MSWKRLLRPWIDRAAALCGLLARHERRMSLGLTILTYHRILPDEMCPDYPIPSLVMPRSAFRAQVAWLAERFRVAPVREALAEFTSIDQESSAALVSITFDDGYLDSYEVAAPILDEFGVPGTFFVAPQIIESEEGYWFDRAALAWSEGRAPAAGNGVRELLPDVPAADLRWRSSSEWIAFLKRVQAPTRDRVLDAVLEDCSAGLDTFRALSIDQTRDLDRRGHEIGSHSLTHPILTLLDDDELHREIHGSKSRLEEWLERPVDGFCYPNGDVDDRVLEETCAAGYTYACSVAPGLNRAPFDSHRLRRRDLTTMRVTDDRLRHCELSFRAEVSGLRDRFR